MAQEVNYDIDMIAKVYNIVGNFKDCFKNFGRDGVESMRNCGIKGGEQRVLIDRACDTMEEKTIEMTKGIDEMAADLNVVMKNAIGFDEQDIIKRAEQLAAEAQKVSGVGIEKVF